MQAAAAGLHEVPAGNVLYQAGKLSSGYNRSAILVALTVIDRYLRALWRSGVQVIRLTHLTQAHRIMVNTRCTAMTELESFHDFLQAKMVDHIQADGNLLETPYPEYAKRLADEIATLERYYVDREGTGKVVRIMGQWGYLDDSDPVHFVKEAKRKAEQLRAELARVVQTARCEYESMCRHAAVSN